ncbi:MAG TPA: DNA polymerase III subunit delta' [Gammaproteobacteria bacterium]|nr:DNA polymerase III subunit delta' [Gammaproteobacteria bacterium]
MHTDALLPEQMALWESLLARKKQGKCPHALLLTGLKGTGKTVFARQFASVLLCNQPSVKGACGHCRACRLYAAGSHPDFMCITPEEGTETIKVDQIRDVVNLANGTAMLGGARVVLIYPADAMNMHASNALLKTLEEPTANTFLILVCEQRGRLPAVIRSRCQTLVFSQPAQDVSSNETIAFQREVVEGLIQLQQKKIDPLSLAARFEEKDIRMLLQCVLSFLRDLLRYQLAGFVHANDQAAMEKIAMTVTPETIFNYADRVQKTYTHLVNALNLNRGLLLKDLFIRWATLC